MSNNSVDFVREIQAFIVETLGLDGVSVDDIDPQAPLFGEGLGLDSIDALELGVAIQKRYGVKMDPNDEAVRGHFASVSALAGFIQQSSPARA